MTRDDLPTFGRPTTASTPTGRAGLARAFRETAAGNQILIAFVQLIAFEIGGILLVFLVLDGVPDQTDEQIERVGEVQIGIVDGGNAIGGGQEAGDLGIGLVARGHILSTHALDGLAGATGLTDLLTGGQQHAHLGVRGHHGGDIAALGHDAQTPEKESADASRAM